jgi:hypothetical protein
MLFVDTWNVEILQQKKFKEKKFVNEKIYIF